MEKLADGRSFEAHSANFVRSIFDQVLLPDRQTLSILRNGLNICTLFDRADSETTMEFLTRPCLKCQNPMNGGVYRALYLCPHCFFEHEGGKKKKRRGKVATATSDVDTLRTEAVKADRAAVTPGIMEVETLYLCIR